MVNTYTGIGSRETPIDICNLFTNVASHLSSIGYTLRSGGADGADTAFESGSSSSDIYLPWSGFNGRRNGIIPTNKQAWDIAKQFHPAWNRLSQGAQKLMARNSCQVLGTNLDSPTEFIICWTPSGLGGGGTGQALRIAKHYNIPIFDAGNYPNIKTCRIELFNFLNK